MPLETATYISDLNVANPAHTDGLSQADSQMRLLKSTIKATFPNFTAAALASTQSQIDTAVAAALLTLVRSGTNPPGMISDFGSATVPTGWLVCDGQAISRTVFIDLFNAIGTTWGAGDGSNTFNVPVAQNRFRRHRSVGGQAGAVGTLQSPVNLTHTHGVTGSTGGDSNDHTHTYGGTTGAMNANAAHTHGVTNLNSAAAIWAGVAGGAAFFGGNQASGPVSTSISINSTNTDHGHTFSGTSSGISTSHTHGFTVTSGSGSADDNESRPYSMSVLTCIKT